SARGNGIGGQLHLCEDVQSERRRKGAHPQDEGSGLTTGVTVDRDLSRDLAARGEGRTRVIKTSGSGVADVRAPHGDVAERGGDISARPSPERVDAGI